VDTARRAFTPRRDSPRPSRAVAASTPPGLVLIEHEVDALSRITRPEVSAVVVRRSKGTPSDPPRVVLPRSFHRSTQLDSTFAGSALFSSELPIELERSIRADLHALSTILSPLSSGDVTAHLGVTRSDECRKYHTDYYRLRLLVSYVGPGTEVVPERGLDRTALGRGTGEDVETENRHIVRDRRAVVRARSLDLVLLKGERFGNGFAAVHRSPPVESAGRARLVLKLTWE
jgi:hypothetical protein